MSPIFRLCSVCGGTYPLGGRSTGKCPPCFKTYERERQRKKPQRVVRGGARWKAAREAVRARDGHQCTRCGSSVQLEVHHVVALEDGGAAYDPANLVTLCANCHRDAGSGQQLAPVVAPSGGPSVG